MIASVNLRLILVLLLICRASTAPVSPNKPDPMCSSAHLVASDQGSLVYKYKTEVKLSVANGQYDIKNQITADVHIKNLNDCNYAVQLKNVKITESQDETESPVTSLATKDLENLVVRCRWVDGFLIAVEADASAKADHVNFIKGILSALQVYSPVPTDGENTVREEDVLGVCTTRYKYSQKGTTTQINKNKDLSTCSKDKIHLSSSPVLTSLLGPLVEEVFSAKSRYVCQTEIRDKKIQSVKCKTIEIDSDSDKKSTDKHTHDNHDHIDGSDSSSSEEDDHDFSDKADEEEISSKLISIKQELKLQATSVVNVDAGSIKNAVRQTLQYDPTTSFDRSNEVVLNLVSKIQGLLKSNDWDQFASSHFVEVVNELRRMSKADLHNFQANADIKNVVPLFLKEIYSHDPVGSSINFDPATLKFTNPLAVFYLDSPTEDLVKQIVQSSNKLTAAQVPEFVVLAATILKSYKARQDNNKDANDKIKEFQKAISKFLKSPAKDSSNVTTAVLAAYAQLGVYDDQVRTLAANDKAPLEVQYQALNTIRHICDDFIDDANQVKIRTDLQSLLLKILQNKSNKNAVRVWAFEALFTSFIYNPEEDDSTLGDNLEKALSEILDQPLNQVNGFIWSALKYSVLDRLCPLRGLAARLRAHHSNKKQFLEQTTLSSRQIQIELPLRRNYRAVIHLCVVFENDRAVPSFIGGKLAFDGIRRETLRLPWIEGALIIENLDWNFADYFYRLDPLNTNKNVDDTYKEKTKKDLPAGLKKLQETYDNKDEDPDPSVHLFLKLFGADIRSRDITDKVQDLLRSNLRTFIRNQVLNKFKDLAGKNPIFRIPLEIGAASAAANGLTLYKSAQLGILADLTADFKDTRDSAGSGTFKLTSHSAISLSFTFQREVSSPLTSLGETVQIGVLSNVPFDYTAVADKNGRTREFNLLNTQSTLLATNFKYALRTSKGVQDVANRKSASIDPSCTPSTLYRALGIRACLELNPFRSIQLGSRPSYPITITLNKDPSIKKWRIGWRFDAKDAPQYEVAVQSIGATTAYPGLGISATKTGTNFDIKVLTGMKSFYIKGTQTGNKFDGTVYSSDDKEVMTTSGTLVINNDGFKLDTKLVDIASKKEVLALKTDIVPNRGKGLTADIALTTPDKARSFKIHFLGDLYQPNNRLVHIDAGFVLGDLNYNGKVHLERSADQTRIELRRSMKLGKNLPQNGYDFIYERKHTNDKTKNDSNIVSHLSLRTPQRDEPVKVFDFKSDFTRTTDLSNATLHSSLDFVLLTRNPPVQERIEVDYIRQSRKPSSQAKRLISPEANLKVQVKTKSNIFNFLLDHHHRKSSEASKKGPINAPPTFDINNKVHIVADTDKLYPDIPRPFAFDVLSDLDFELLNKVDYKFQYDLRRRQRSAVFTYHSQVDKITDGHLFSGTSKSELQWDNKQKKATSTGSFSICTNSRSLKTHWDIDTNIVPDKNDVTLDVNIRFDRQPKKDSPKSFIGTYNVTLRAPKHESIQLIDLDGNLTKQIGKFETYNSIAFRREKKLKELNLNVIVHRNQTGDGSLKTKLAVSLPFKYIPYITHKLIIQRTASNGRVKNIQSTLLAKPVFAHYGQINIDRSDDDKKPPCVHVKNVVEYLRANGDNLNGFSEINVHRWSKLHTEGYFKRNNDLLHKHSIGYIFSNKTRKIAFSLVSPQISKNPLSFIGELTIDRENRIGKLKWPQEVTFHLEFGTPLSNLTALYVSYKLPMFNKDADRTVDAYVGFKLASPKITPISMYFYGKGSLNTTLHISDTINIGDDISLGGSLTAQYNPQLISQISISTATKFYDKEFQNSLYALLKQHQLIVRGIINTTNDEDYKYEMDIGFDDDSLTGHTERTDGQQTIISDIDAKKCTPTEKFSRCYKGDITVRTGVSGAGKKGTFDVSLGRGSAKIDIKVPEQIELKFNHIHNGRIRDEDFSSKTTIEGKSLQADNKRSFNYAGSVEKEDGKWNNIQLQSSIADKKTGQKVLASDINFNQKITNKLSGQFQRKINVNIQRSGLTVIDWASDAVSCKDANPSNVLTGICETGKFTLKTSNVLAQRLRQRLELPPDPKLSNAAGQVTYDGTLKLDLKFDPKTGPHTCSLDINRLQEDAVDLNVSYQPRYDKEPMNLDLKANFPRQNPISVKYDEKRNTPTNFHGTLKYSFNSNDKTAEKAYECDVDRPDASDFSVNCKGERTTLTIDVDRNAGKSKAYIDLNRFEGERFGYEGTRNHKTNELDFTLYTLITSWNIKRQPQKSTTIVVKQKTKEVLRVESVKVNDHEVTMKFTPSNIQLKLEWDNSTVVTLKQTQPQQRNLATLTVDRARIRSYLPSLRNQNRPSHDIDEAGSTSKKPLVELAFDSHTIISLSQALDKLGSHNGLYGLDTVKKSFKLQIGDAPLTIYNIQHWKTHREHSQLPESYSIRVVNNANGNFIQATTNKWNEDRLIAKISHSFDGGKTTTTDLKVDRNYGHQVGSIYFFHSLGYRNIEGSRQLRNFTRHFLRSHLLKDLNQTNLAELVRGFRKRVRSILDVDYNALKAIVATWKEEPEKSFLRQWSNRLGLSEFFVKYPTFGEASDRISVILRERAREREEFWRNRIAAIVDENRIKDLAERAQARRTELIKRLLDKAEKALDRFLPKVDQADVDKRIANYIGKLLATFEQYSKRKTEQWKAVFKAIDNASKGAENKWFRILVADIDSDAFAKAADAETDKVIKKLGDSSKLFISNLQHLSKRITKRREAIRERVKNAIRHIPKAYINNTNFEVLVPLGREPGSYIGRSELILGVGSLLRNRDQAYDTIRSILESRITARMEKLKNSFKALRSLLKRLLKRNPSLTPEFKAIIAQTGDAIDLHGNYIYLNPACDYIIAHDFFNLQFSFRYFNGKIYSIIPNQVEIKDHECSDTGRVQVCNHGGFYTLNVPMHYSDNVDGAVGNTRDRTRTKNANLSRWLVKDCPAATRDQPKKGGQAIIECTSNDDDDEEFCENFVRTGLKEGKDRRQLIAQALQARQAST
ncbi:unnamed protein product [Adineta steineri]|uniref:Vitellogenin domain-containing protein n=1 Tax=Adineta steineri TaxID=433720 RepID=A0A813NKG3_9BILA|nr:unnamed protein product [Adineta steineri]